jgi:hypothetical protein
MTNDSQSGRRSIIALGVWEKQIGVECDVGITVWCDRKSAT